MELRHWRYFSKVVELMSFSQAANFYHVAQSAVSRQVKELEDELGFALLIRDTRKIRLTPVGELVFNRIRNVLTEHDQCIDEARLYEKNVRDQIKIAFVGSATHFFLPQLIHDFNKQYPMTGINLKEGSPSTHRDLFEHGEVDLILGRSIPHSKNVRQHLLYRDYLRLVEPKSSSMSQLKLTERIGKKEIYVLSPDESPMVYFAAIRFLRELGISHQRVVKVSDYQSAIVMIEAGLGVGILPGCLKKLHGNRVQFCDSDVHEPINLVMTYRIHIPPHIRKLIKFIKNRCPIEI